MDKKFSNNNLGYSFERLKKGLKESQEILDEYDTRPSSQKSQNGLLMAYARAWGKLSAVVETHTMFFSPTSEDDLSALTLFTQAQTQK